MVWVGSNRAQCVEVGFGGLCLGESVNVWLGY